MSQLDFLDIARLVNHSRTTSIDLSPAKSVEGRWAIYDAEHRVHLSSLPFKILYIYSAATNTDIRNAATAAKSLGTGEIHVVHPQSLDALNRRHSETAQLFDFCKGLWTTRDYLRSFFNDELQAYVGRLIEQAPDFYIDPHVLVPAGFKRKIPSPLLSFLQESGQTAGGSQQSLAILLAEPGQGKTFMSRHLVAELARRKGGVIPLMVNSAQWQALSLHQLSSLSTTLLNSFRHFGAPISWLEGHEEEFLAAALKADLFRVVFDGFDEYVLRNRIAPLDVLASIAKLSSDHSTRIVITSRASFWNSNLPEAELREFIEDNGVLLYEILPFEKEHARKYFEIRLGDQKEKVELASSIYAALRTDNEAFVGRGFVLSLIADLAQRSPEQERKVKALNTLGWLTEALCEREIERQQLPFTVHEQLEILRKFAIEASRGYPASSELLGIAIELVKPSFDLASALSSTIDKLKSHPLIEKRSAEDIWNIKQEQIRILLIAEQLISWSSAEKAEYIGSVTFDAGVRQDLGEMIVDRILAGTDANQYYERLREFVGSLVDPGANNTLQTLRLHEGARLAAVTALMAVDRIQPPGSSRADRTDELRKIVGAEMISDLAFTGAIARFDLRGLALRHCSFDGVTFANCVFDENTVFEICSFVGGLRTNYSDGLGLCQFEKCKYDDEAHAAITNAQIKEGKKEYSQSSLKMDIRCVILKFLRSDDTTLGTIEARELELGPIATSKFKEPILSELRRGIIVPAAAPSKRLAISGAAEESVKFYSANNVFTGILQTTFENLSAKLSLDR